MKNILKTILCTVVATVGVSLPAMAQGASADALGRITISTYVPPQVESLSPTVASMLKNKLNQMVSANGIAGTEYDRFILTANIVVMSKDLTATAPPMTALTLDVTFYIGDGFDGKKFSSKTVTVKGVDTNETKAYISAIKNIKVNDPALQAFIADGKNKIISYYNGKCSQILQEAKAYEAQNRFEESLFLLTSIPQEATDCYNKALALMPAVFKKTIDRNCKLKLAEANNIWSAGQNLDAANRAGAILVSIDPQSACYGEVKALSDKIGKRVLELDKREWNYKMDTEVNLQRDMIKAYRDVGVAYGNGQPKSVTYNVSGWW
jgi:hypothetical protein